jgi:hypothetical protein
MFEKTLQKHDCASRDLLGKKKKTQRNFLGKKK